MSNMIMDQYTLQSYFESVCKSFYIAYTQEKRSEEIWEELHKENHPVEFDVLRMLLSNFWEKQLWEKNFYQIREIISEMKEQEFSIIVTSREEVVTLMAFFREVNLEDNEIINVREEYLPSFPKDEMSQKFLKAYLSKDDAEMKKVIEKYF